MNARQERVLELLRAPKKSTEFHQREIYEGADGMYCITYPFGQEYEHLTKQDVDELLLLGLIKKKWPGCFELARGTDAEEHK